MARTIVFGRSGAGKSWFLGWYLENVVSEFDFAVHVDIEDEEQGLSQSENPVFKTFYVDEEFYNRTVLYSPSEDEQEREMPLVHAVVLHNNHVRVVPDSLTTEEQEDLFAQVCGLAMEIGKTDNTFHVSADEAHQVVPDNGDDIDDRVERLLTGGRKKGVEYALSTQRPSNLHEEAFSQANYGVYFSLTKDVDVARVNGSSNYNAYQLLPDLQPREYIQEDLDSGDVFRASSNDLEREHPHLADDDGIADEALAESVTDAEAIDVQGGVEEEAAD
jgi:hypothetical protein